MDSSNYPSSSSMEEGEENREKLGAIVVVEEREHMFDKVVTPSDVGKLNRLVIPKQHAEKYFPLDSSTNEKGLLLNFEDLTGKAWRFRYSYWNSSQSYVMTKGWSRFVKEKKLDAGDIVSFHRESNKFFIDWRRRRPDIGIGPPPLLQFSLHPPPFGGGWSRSSTAAAPAFLLRSYPQDYSHPRPTHILGNPNVWDHLTTSNLVPYHYSHPQFSYAATIPTTSTTTTTTTNMFLRPSSFQSVQHPRGPVPEEEGGAHAHAYTYSHAQARARAQAQGNEPMVFDSVPVVQGKGKAAGKRLRLFGVNMECCPPNVHNDYDASSSSSNTHQNPLTLQLDLSVIDKGKLSSSSSSPSPSSMSLDLDI